MNKEQIEKEHLKWFRKMLIRNGTPKNITDKVIVSSCSYQISLEAFKAGAEGQLPR